MAGPRIIVWDVETSQNTVAVFSLKNQDWIQPDNILTERGLISASWKVLGEKKVHAVSLINDRARFDRNPRDDRHVCEVLHQVLSNADVLVAHNGDAYDIKFTETRFIAHGLPPLPPIIKIDTLKVARERFLFNANNLDYLAKYLGVGRKTKTTPGLWLRVLAGEAAAVREMVRYNKTDVVLLERVFNKLRPYIANHVNRGLFGGTGCPRCGSVKVQARGVHRSLTRIYQRMMCQACGGWYRLNTSTAGAKTRTL